MSVKNIAILPIYYDYVLCTDYDVYVLVGGRASGKSYLMEQYTNIALNNHKDYTMLVIEDMDTNIGAGTKDGILARRAEFGIDGYIKAVKVPPEIDYINGNKVLFKGYRTDDQQKNVKSLNGVTACWYEERQNITQQQFRGLRMQLRGGERKDRKLFLTLNPVNSDSYINKTFFEGYTPKRSQVFQWFEDGRPKVFERPIISWVEGKKAVIKCLVIVTTYRDNPYLTIQQKADIERLKNDDPEQWEMLANGKFIKPAGAFFREFTPGLHTCEPWVLPKEWRKYRTMDYGLDMLACYWIAVDSYGKAYVYRELYQPDTIISDAAKLIREMTPTDEDIYSTFAPPDMWNRRQETGKSVAEIFAENGVDLEKANNDRERGWLDLKEWLKPYTDKEGKRQANIVIFDTCTNLIRTIPQLMRDKVRPNDVDSKSNHELTHGPDALRYFVSGRPLPTDKPEEKPIYNFDFERPQPEIDHEEITII